MRRYLTITSITFLVLFIHSGSYANEPEAASDASYESQRNVPILATDLQRTDLALTLIGTINRGGEGKAFIKNTSTGMLRMYAEGDIIDVVDNEEVRLVKTSDCMVMIQRRGRYETLQCDDVAVASAQPEYKAPSPLAKYRVVDSPTETKSSPKAVNTSKAVKVKSANAGASKAAPKATPYEEQIAMASEKHGIDPYLVKAVIKAESNFNSDAVSNKNAQGIMQLMPGTAKDYGVKDAFNASDNIDGGVRLLRDLMSYFDGDLGLALAAYNAGKGAVVKYGNQIPPYSETVDYVDKVMGYYDFLKDKK